MTAPRRIPQEFVPAEIADRLIAGERPVKVWRGYRGMTQKQLADAAGISKPYLSQIENGLRDASIGVLRALAAALKVDLDDLSPPPAGNAAKRSKARAARRSSVKCIDCPPLQIRYASAWAGARAPRGYGMIALNISPKAAPCAS
jgi:transcriptional regulator with XRE-family HTH domain